MEYLLDYFLQNGYSSNLFFKQLKVYLDKIYRPSLPVQTVPRLKMYLPMPFLGYKQNDFSKQLKQVLDKFYPFLDVHISPVNPLNLASLFKFKDSLPMQFKSGVVYRYTCPKCNLGTYIGCTIRQLRARFAAHRGVSHRTGITLNKKEKSSIREHSLKCKSELSINDVKILGSFSNDNALLIAESLYLKIKTGHLNNDSTSVPLYIA